MHDVLEIDDRISRLQTTFLIDEAQRYLLPTPKFSDDHRGAWERATTAAHYQLKLSAIAELSAAVNRVKKERRDAWQSWVTLLIGVIGALIGLMSILKK